MKLFCIAGQMRSGKNVTGEYIAQKINIKTASFAKPVKEIFCKTFSVDFDFVEKWKVENYPPPGFNKSVRQSLQFIGDGFRSINPNVWVDYAFSNNSKEVCYTDGRYVNELIYIKNNNGYNILIYRPNYENNDNNESESQIKRLVDWFAESNLEGDVRSIDKSNSPSGCELVDFFIVNNKNLTNLYKKIDDLILSRLLL